jgi:tRNA splicing endonuclease
MASKKPSVLGLTVVVVDEAALSLLFAHRVLTACYARRTLETNSKKRKIFEVRRKRPRIEVLQAMQDAASSAGAAAMGAAAAGAAAAGAAAAGTAAAAHPPNEGSASGSGSGGAVPGDHRAELRTKLVQKEMEDRKAVDEYVQQVALPLRMLPEETRTALDLGLIRLEAHPGRLWVARALRGAEDAHETQAVGAAEAAERAQGWAFPQLRHEVLQCCVFRELHRRGWIITKGTNFGCDYLLYTSDPGTTHSTFMVVVTDAAAEHILAHPVKWTAVAALATKVRKTALLACVEERALAEPATAAADASAVSFTLLEGCLFRRSDFLNGKALEEQALEEQRREEFMKRQRENPLLVAAEGGDEDEGAGEDSIAV